MTHGYGCNGTEVLQQMTAVGRQQWFIYRCDQCAATELSKTPKGARTIKCCLTCGQPLAPTLPADVARHADCGVTR